MKEERKERKRSAELQSLAKKNFNWRTVGQTQTPVVYIDK